MAPPEVSSNVDACPKNVNVFLGLSGKTPSTAEALDTATVPSRESTSTASAVVLCLIMSSPPLFSCVHQFRCCFDLWRAFLYPLAGRFALAPLPTDRQRVFFFVPFFVVAFRNILCAAFFPGDVKGEHFGFSGG